MPNVHNKWSAITIGGIVLLLIVLLIVGGIAGARWLSRADNSPSNHHTVIVVRELGIQLTVPDSIKDLNYRVFTIPLQDGKLSTVAGFSTATLTARDPGCSLAEMPLGSLSRDEGQYPRNAPDAAIIYGVLVKQFPTFYIAAGSPQGACSSNPTTEGLASQDRTDFIQAQSSIQPLD